MASEIPQRCASKLCQLTLRTAFGQNNIPEDELFGLLISAPNNCLPECWAQHRKTKAFDAGIHADALVQNHGVPVQCCCGVHVDSPAYVPFTILKG